VVGHDVMVVILVVLPVRGSIVVARWLPNGALQVVVEATFGTAKLVTSVVQVVLAVPGIIVVLDSALRTLNNVIVVVVLMPILILLLLRIVA